MRPLALVLIFALASACADSTPEAQLSYERCNPGDGCGIGTACIETRLTTSGARAWQCTTTCTNDTPCPGATSRCIATSSAPGAVAQCARTCTSDTDCRTATRCRAVNTLSGTRSVCVPDTGPRPCTADGDCVPFRALCDRADGGTDGGVCVPMQ